MLKKLSWSLIILGILLIGSQKVLGGIADDLTIYVLGVAISTLGFALFIFSKSSDQPATRTQIRLVVPLFVSMVSLLIGYLATKLICSGGRDYDCGWNYLMFFLAIPFIFLVSQFGYKIKTQRSLKRFTLILLVALLIFSIGYVVYIKN